MTRNEAFARYLESLSRRERRAKTRDIREKLDVSRNVIYDWTSGRSQIKRVYFDKIIEIVGVDLSAGVEN